MRRKMGWQAAWNGRRAWHTSVPLKFAKRWRMAVNVGLVAGSLRRRLAARCMEAGEAYFFGNKAIPDFHGQEVGAFFALASSLPGLACNLELGDEGSVDCQLGAILAWKALVHHLGPAAVCLHHAPNETAWRNMIISEYQQGQT